MTWRKADSGSCDSILAMIVSLRHLLRWIVSSFRSRENLALENLALRRQLLALHAQRPRTRLTALHKLFWVALRTYVLSAWGSNITHTLGIFSAAVGQRLERKLSWLEHRAEFQPIRPYTSNGNLIPVSQCGKCKEARLNQQPLFFVGWAWHPDLVYLRHRHAN